MLCRRPPMPPAPDADGLELKIKLSGPTLVKIASAITAALVGSGAWMYIQRAPQASPTQSAGPVQEIVEQP